MFERKNATESIRPPRDFNTLRFSTLRPCYRSAYSIEENRYVESRYQERCVLHGVPMQLDVERLRWSSDSQPLVEDHTWYHLYDDAGQEGVSGDCRIYVVPKQQRVVANTAVHRTSRTAQIPVGVGLLLYTQMLNYIDDVSTATRINIHHEVERKTWISETPMSDAQWERVFVPLLRACSYTEICSGKWTKVYMPQTRARQKHC